MHIHNTYVISTPLAKLILIVLLERNKGIQLGFVCQNLIPTVVIMCFY